MHTLLDSFFTHCGLVTSYGNGSGSTLAQVMACYLTSLSHYLNQCWLIISEVHYQGSFTRDASSVNDYNLFETYISKISFKFLRGQWVKITLTPKPPTHIPQGPMILEPEKYGSTIIIIIFKFMVQNDSSVFLCEISPRFKPQNFINQKSAMVQAMAWCCQAKSHHLSQCWSRFILSCGITRPHC